MSTRPRPRWLRRPKPWTAATANKRRSTWRKVTWLSVVIAVVTVMAGWDTAAFTAAIVSALSGRSWTFWSAWADGYTAGCRTNRCAAEGCAVVNETWPAWEGKPGE